MAAKAAHHLCRLPVGRLRVLNYAVLRTFNNDRSSAPLLLEQTASLGAPGERGRLQVPPLQEKQNALRFPRETFASACLTACRGLQNARQLLRGGYVALFGRFTG